MPRRGVGEESPTFQLQDLVPVEVAFSPEDVDQFLRANGVTLVHYRSMRCPIGLSDPDDLRRPHPHHENCVNGFLLTKAGEVTCAFTGNTKDSRRTEAGLLQEGTARVTLPRFYDDRPDERVRICKFDRLYLKDEEGRDPITVDDWHTFAAHETGRDRLQHPAVDVVDLVDAAGNRYAEGTDFCVQQGQIVWGTQRRPGRDQKSGKGVVCTVRYSYRPFWFVQRLDHELRFARAEDQYNGGRELVRMPMAAVLQREYVFQAAQADELAQRLPGAERQQPGPEDGSLGPR